MLPILTSERLMLEPATSDDAELLYTLWTMPDVLRYLFDGVTMSREEAVAHLKSYTCQNAEGFGLWLMHQREDRSFCGEIGLAFSTMQDLDPLMGGEIEFQIALHPDAWGKGYGEEALRTVLDYGVTTQGLSHVMGVADAPNKGSRKLQEKMGFVWQREIEGDAGPLVIYKWVPA